MGPKHTYPTRNYGVGQYLFTLRSRAKLTQAELASQIGVHRRSVQNWESGETYPTAENLRALIALLITVDAFTSGQEHDEATDLWQKVSQAAPHPFPLFDTAWFNQLLAGHTTGGPALTSPSQGLRPEPVEGGMKEGGASAPALAVDWPQAGGNIALPLPFTASPVIGRGPELTNIAGILNNPACRLLTLLGPG